MTDPLEDPEGAFPVLVNEENQHSLRPRFAEVPAGRTVAHGPAGRRDCLDHVEADWTDVRPAGLVRAMPVRAARPAADPAGAARASPRRRAGPPSGPC